MRRQTFPMLISLILLSTFEIATAQSAAPRIRFKVTLAEKIAPKTLSGRLLVYMTQNKPTSGAGYIRPALGPETLSVWIAARELNHADAGDTVEIDPDEMAFPAPFSKAPSGNWYVMAMLDVDHNVNYRSFTAGDLVAKPVLMEKLDPAHAGDVPLNLTDTFFEPPLSAGVGIELVTFNSPLLSAFFSRAIEMKAVVALPPSYSNSTRRYPTVFVTHGFGANMDTLVHSYADPYVKAMQAKEAPEMIYVILLGQLPTGLHEFADSANNGPWSDALTSEFIPYLETKYRMERKSSSRFLTGHSSGGWAGLWLQVNYPKFFGGVWATSPDPVDFRSFIGSNIAGSVPENVYHKPDGSPWTFDRIEGKDTMTVEEFVQQERVLGEYGGQFASFEAVFSPRGSDGRPMPLFDRYTGEVDPVVAKAWEKYDISRLIRARWKEIGSDLNGKIHVIVGTQDTFHLEQPVHLLEGVMQELGSDAQFTYVEGKDHFNLYSDGLRNRIANEMYGAAH